MQELIIPVKAQKKQKAATPVTTSKWINILSLTLYPVGIFRIWKMKSPTLMRWLYVILGLPLFLIGFIYFGIVAFAGFLPELDHTVGNRADKTIYNTEGNYSATFIKTGAETNGAYELVQVELEPYGGNDWHYHKSFVEEFTVVQGQVKIGRNGNEYILNEGESAKANKEEMHFFKNTRGENAMLLVKITPAAGLEKTLRVAYGLINDGLLKNDMTQNPWHMALLLGYSESYLPGLPSWFQEPLINALAKIAQWKGEDKALYKYFK
jgi:quercetin dioxygenase-like cupin family protein